VRLFIVYLIPWAIHEFLIYPGMIDILSAALDASYTISTVFIFFTLQYPENGRIGLNTIQTWWGNTVYTKTADFRGVPIKTLAEGQTFGPKSW
jgi:hypothetical protein